MEKQLLGHIKNLKSSLNRGKYDKKKVKDAFAFQVSLTYIDRAIERGVLTESALKQLLTGKKK